jgi:hypothetical protein
MLSPLEGGKFKLFFKIVRDLKLAIFVASLLVSNNPTPLLVTLQNPLPNILTNQ